MQRRAADLVRLADLLEHTVGDGRHHVGAVHAFQYDHELVAADACRHLLRLGVRRLQACQRIPGPQRQLQAPRDLAQQLVAGGVAHGVVDLLEAVEVHEQQRKTVARVAAGMGNGLLQPLHHRRAVGQLGQCIGVGVVVELRFQRAPLGHVGEAGDDATDVARRVALRLGVEQQPAQFVVGQAQAQGLVARGLAVGQCAQRRVQAQRVVGAVFVQHAPARVARLQALHLRQAQAHHALGGAVGIDNTTVGIAHHHAGRQRVPQRLQLGLLHDTAGDVGVDADITGQLVVTVVQRAQVHIQPQVVPVAGAVQPLLANAGTALQRIAQVARGVGVGVRVGQEVGRALARHLVQPPARHLGEGRVGPQQAAFGVGDHDQGRGVLGHQGQAAQLQRLVLEPADVGGHGACRGLHHGQRQQAQQQQQGRQAQAQLSGHRGAAVIRGAAQASRQRLRRDGRRPRFSGQRPGRLAQCFGVAVVQSPQQQLAAVPELFALILPAGQRRADMARCLGRTTHLGAQQAFQRQRVGQRLVQQPGQRVDMRQPRAGVQRQQLGALAQLQRQRAVVGGALQQFGVGGAHAFQLPGVQALRPDGHGQHPEGQVHGQPQPPAGTQTVQAEPGAHPRPGGAGAGLCKGRLDDHGAIRQAAWRRKEAPARRDIGLPRPGLK